MRDGIPPVGVRADCSEQSPTGFMCTLDSGHDGDHVAHSGDLTVCAVWGPQDTQDREALSREFVRLHARVTRLTEEADRAERKLKVVWDALLFIRDLPLMPDEPTALLVRKTAEDAVIRAVSL